MKAKILILILLLPGMSAIAQQEVPPELKSRLETYLKLNKEQDFDRMMDFIHPKLFELAPRSQMVEVFKKSFDNDEIRLIIDSIDISKYSEPFHHQGATYVQVDYYLGLRLYFKDTASIDEEFIEIMTSSFEESFKGKQVKYNAESKAFEIAGIDKLFAIRDKSNANWMFLGHNGNKSMLEKLFPGEVIRHFGLE